MPYKDMSKNGKWRAKVIRSGHRKTKLFTTKSEAIQWESEQEKLPLCWIADYFDAKPAVSFTVS